MSRVDDVLLSVRPNFAIGLISGTKTAEIRRRFPSRLVGRRAFVYSTHPERAVIGFVRLERIVTIVSEEAWGTYGSRLRIGPHSLADYLEGSREASVLEVTAATPFECPVTREALIRRLQLTPAQNYRYVSPDQSAALENMGHNLEGHISE